MGTRRDGGVMDRPMVTREDGYWKVTYPAGDPEGFRTFRRAIRGAEDWSLDAGAERIMTQLRELFPNEPWTQTPNHGSRSQA
jgi:hypothetical protein